MEPMKLSFGALLAYLNRAIVHMEDPRQAARSNSKPVSWNSLLTSTGRWLNPLSGLTKVKL